MLRTLRNTAALIVVASFVAAPLAAQTTAPAPIAPAPVTATPLAPAPAAPTAPAATAPAAPAAIAPDAALPKALSDLGITSATVAKGKRDWQRVEGTLPGGTAFRAILDTQGQLRMLRAQGDAALPADLVNRLVPQAVRNSPVYGELAQIGGIAQGPEGVMVFGKAADGQMVRAGFSPDGALQRFGRGGDGHDKMGKRDHDRKGDRDRKKGDHDKKGDRHKRDRDHSDRDHGDGEQRGMMAPQGAALTDDAVRNALAQAGYTQPGAINRDGPRVTVPAVNPEGENVTVTVNPRGVVVREEAR